jgi:hypothetical protein
MIEFSGIRWNTLGRNHPAGAKLEVHNIHAKWLDLVWWCEQRGVWVYLSTVAK